MQAARLAGADRSEVIPCLTGNVVWSLIRLGMLRDPRVQARHRVAHDLHALRRRPDRRGTHRLALRPFLFGDVLGRVHTCHMGAVKALKALAEIPPERRSTPEVRRTLDEGARVHAQASRPQAQPRPDEGPLQARLEAPWLPADVPDGLLSEILGILTRLGYKDERMREAVDLWS